MYAMLFDCCVKYFENLAWRFPAECPDGQGCCGLDYQQFSTHLKFDIPSLYRQSNGRIDKPGDNYFDSSNDYDQYALLDLIEFIGQNCRDISVGSFHSFFGHHHIRFMNRQSFCREIHGSMNYTIHLGNLIFNLGGAICAVEIV